MWVFEGGTALRPVSLLVPTIGDDLLPLRRVFVFQFPPSFPSSSTFSEKDGGGANNGDRGAGGGGGRRTGVWGAISVEGLNWL